MVRSRQFWLKSTKIRSPRSSFHQSVVTPVVAPLQLAAEADRGVPDVDELPARLDPHVDVHAAVAARSSGSRRRPSSSSSSRATPATRTASANVGAGLRVEVDAQLVGVVDVGAAHRPGVEGQRAHLRAPHRHRDLGRADLVGGAAGREGDRRRSRGSRARPWAPASGRTRRRRGPCGPVASLMPSRTPVGQRSSAVGRSRSARIRPSPTRAKYSATISLVTSGVRVGRLVDHPVGAGHPDRRVRRRRPRSLGSPCGTLDS